MIPKSVHYVWLSGDKKPQLVKDCLASWRANLPEYEIREWTYEDVKDIKSDFLQEAIEHRKWAFATDFLRFYIIYNYSFLVIFNLYNKVSFLIRENIVL